MCTVFSREIDGRNEGVGDRFSWQELKRIKMSINSLAHCEMKNMK